VRIGCATAQTHRSYLRSVSPIRITSPSTSLRS
jgi:hypothetical protein